MTDQTRATAPRAFPTPAVVSACPYLLAGDGTWRASDPTRDHRCTAVAPAAQIAADKQRRLCLTDQHYGCATYRAAAQPSHADGVDGRGTIPRLHRPIVQTVPMVLDHGRIAFAIPRGADRGFAQMALLALMILAFGAILVARFPGAGGSVDGGVAGSTDRPSATPTSAAASPTADPADPTPTPTEDGEPTDAAPTDVPAASASPAGGGSTYTVQSGDTLSGIAADHGTTWQEVAELNGIDDPSSLRVGQELQLP